MPTRISLATANTPGAIALIQMHGGDVAAMLHAFTGQMEWPQNHVKYVHFAAIDAGLAVVLRDDWAQLMPHGGPRVVQKMIAALVSLGCVYDAAPPSRETYPEAANDLEADMLATLARAASPAAIDLLLNQPMNWRRWVERLTSTGDRDDARTLQSAHLHRSRIFARLLTPPSIVVIGQPNVGKSTLTNRMLGRAASIVADLPGTTRDWVAGLAELPPGIAVRWMDTPGLRDSDDVIEQRAIELANQIIREADVVIVMRDPVIDWPDQASLPRRPDVWVMNKSDTVNMKMNSADTGDSRDKPLRISAESGEGIAALSCLLIGKLGLANIDKHEPWAFCERLQMLVRKARWEALSEYCGL